MRVFFAVGIVLFMPGAALSADESEPLTVRVYPVADLVVQLSGEGEGLAILQAAGLQLDATADAVTALTGGRSRSETALAENLEELVGVIRTATVPGEWESEGGPGRVVAYKKTLSLIVRQTAAGHAEVTALLEQLRDENNLRISLQIEYLEKKSLPTPPVQGVGYPGPTDAPPGSPSYVVKPPQPTAPETPTAPIRHEAPAPVATFESTLASLSEKHGASMTDEELAEFRTTLEPVAINQVLYNGVVANGRAKLMMLGTSTAVISPDRRYVDFHLSPMLEIGAASASVRIPCNETAVMRVASGDGDTILLLVSASLTVPEEEEERIPGQE